MSRSVQYISVKQTSYITIIACILLFFSKQNTFSQGFVRESSDTIQATEPVYSIDEKIGYPFTNKGGFSPLLMPLPSNIEQNIVYDPQTHTYKFSENVGRINYRTPTYMDFEDYKNYELKTRMNNYWFEKARSGGGAGPGFLKNLRLGNQNLNKVFGTDAIAIDPTGSAELTFGYGWTKTNNPSVPIENRSNGSFLFEENIEMNVSGKVGDKLALGISYNTEATFEFENKTNLNYEGKEDEIIKNIEAGDVSFNVPGTLISGSQSLFGIKTELQFGKLSVSTVVSHQRGETSSINVQGGAQQTEYEISADEYDENRHFFLGHFFRDNYNDWLKNLPSVESRVTIKNIEVWVVNKRDNFEESRNILAFTDLGEGYGPDGSRNFGADSNLLLPDVNVNRPIDNNRNNLYQSISSNEKINDLSTIDQAILEYTGGAFSFEDGRDYIKMESARPLRMNEYELNDQLGYISLNSPLRNDEILAVAFSYDYNGETYIVGELSANKPGKAPLVVKLLKGTAQSPRYAYWDLMMKNVYSIGAYQVSSENFVLNVLYRDDKTGTPVNFIAVDTLKHSISANVNKRNLIKVMELDRLDKSNQPVPDGVFDFVEGITIDSRRGRVYFPVIEPFGQDLRNKFTDNNPDDEAKNKTADMYVFEELYDSTHTRAKQEAQKNKFLLSGHYQSSFGSDIYLNAMNIPRGSVRVTAGGTPLKENEDYTVDYTLGRVKILNEGLLQSGTPIKISLESNSLFNLQTKTFIGTHLDYKISDNFNVGATYMRLAETPLTPKVSMGDEPISNTMFGINTSYRTKSQYLTTLIDKLPLLETKEPSSISFDAEMAYLLPGQSKYIKDDKKAKNPSVAYIDDFEGAQTKLDLRSIYRWNFSSIPSGQGNEYTYSDSSGLTQGFGRAKITWFQVDPIFYNNSGKNVDGVSDSELNSHLTREIKMKELFPEKDEEFQGYASRIHVLNLVYYPNERGIYNYNTFDLNEQGLFNTPGEKWGGMMREITTKDFETSNIEYIEFWMMDPYVEEEGLVSGGDLYFHLGEISEDILPDSRKSFENGLPITEVKEDIDTTDWGFVPRGQAINNSFATTENGQELQDVGLDGLSDADETIFHADFLNAIPAGAQDIIVEDPSADNWDYFITPEHSSENHGILRRYKYYNGIEGNSPYVTSGDILGSKQTPDVEDIDDDNTLNTTETYYQYHVSLRPENLAVGQNFIVDVKEGEKNGAGDPVNWYLFRIPIEEYERSIGEISGFNSIRFARVVMKNFTDTVVCRFASLDLVRSEWRRYKFDLKTAGASTTLQNSELSNFEVSAVNIEENSEKVPIPYVLPPGVDRETDIANTHIQQLNEQSLLIKVENLEETDARAVFKNVDLDLRQYKNLELFIHAEALVEGETESNELTAFIRMGSDYTNNYYELELPLKLTPHNVSPTQEDSIWRNKIVISLEELVNLKRKRNRLQLEDPTEYSLQKVFGEESMESGERQFLKVKGKPNLAEVRQIMLGVRNPGDELPIDNDGEAKSAEIWFNELRLTDFDNKGGGAATGRMQIQLADFGVLNLAGSTSQPGFGGIEEKVDERQKEYVHQYDINTTLELGKLFPEKAQVSIPMYFGISNTIITPEYFPNDPDIKYSELKKDYEDRKHILDSLNNISRDVTSRKSFNLTNIRWNKNLEKVKLVAPRNFSASILYSETSKTNYNTEYDNMRRYGGNIGYSYSAPSKAFKPFSKSKSKLLRNPSMRIIRDINLNLYPQKFSLVNTFDRSYQEIKLRDVDGFKDAFGNTIAIDSTVDKNFKWIRNYQLTWDLTQKLKFNYSATNYSRITEPSGAFDLFEDNDKYYSDIDWKDSVWSSIIHHGGRNMDFNQKFNLDYTLPLDKIPLLNWTSTKVTYNANFFWTRGPEFADLERLPAGHTLRNSNNLKLSTRLNMRNLYNKVGYIKQLESKYRPNAKKKDVEYKKVTFEKRTFLNADNPRNISHNLKTTRVEVKAYDADQNELPVEVSIIDENKVAVLSKADVRGVTIVVEGEIEKGENPFIFIAENGLRFLLGIKSIDASYTISSGTLLPGYLPETKMLGFNTSQFNEAPGWPFVLGYNDVDYPRYAAEKNWLTQDTNILNTVNFNRNENFQARTTFEPFRGFRLTLDVRREYREQTRQDYFYDPGRLRNTSGLESYRYSGSHYFAPSYTGGNYSISTITIRTAFEGVKFWEQYNKQTDYRSEAFEQFKDNSLDNAMSLNSRYQIPVEDTTGYRLTTPEAMLPAFYAAYTGVDPKEVSLDNFFHWFMLPNWNFTFSGLSKIEFFKQYFKRIDVKHAYRSTYSIGSFATNEFFEDIEGYSFPELVNGYSKYTIGGISINERFGPLIGFEMEWINSLKTTFKIDQSRTISLSTTNNRLTENLDKSFVIGAGYTIKEVPLKINTASGTKNFKSDINVKFDLSIKDDITILRTLTLVEEEDQTDITTGSRLIGIGLTADYTFTGNFNMQFYTDYSKTSPYTTDKYERQEFNIGLTMRLSL